MKHNVNNFFQFQLSRVDDADSNNQNNYENPVLEMLLTANPEKFIVMLTLIHVNSETLSEPFNGLQPTKLLTQSQLIHSRDKTIREVAKIKKWDNYLGEM